MVDESWTLSELVAKAETSIATLPEPKNGQVRAVPDERTVRYYGTIGLLDRPAAMRGRTALYGRRHLAQVVAIKRLQGAGRSLAEIQQLWPTLDDATLARMTGVHVAATDAVPGRATRRDFWKRDVEPGPIQLTPGKPVVGLVVPATGGPIAPTELRVELAPNVSLVIALPEDAVSISSADVRAFRAAAAALVAELARRGLTGDQP